MGWNAVVDNVVVLGVALPVRAEAVELSCRQRAGRKEGGLSARSWPWGSDWSPPPHCPPSQGRANPYILFLIKNRDPGQGEGLRLQT